MKNKAFGFGCKGFLKLVKMLKHVLQSEKKKQADEKSTIEVRGRSN